jgi:hypothetical protein
LMRSARIYPPSTELFGSSYQLQKLFHLIQATIFQCVGGVIKVPKKFVRVNRAQALKLQAAASKLGLLRILTDPNDRCDISSAHLQLRHFSVDDEDRNSRE